MKLVSFNVDLWAHELKSSSIEAFNLPIAKSSKTLTS